MEVKGIRHEAFNCEKYVSGKSMEDVMADYGLTSVVKLGSNAVSYTHLDVYKRQVRTCTGCRQAKNKKDLIRVVRDKEGNVSVDATGKLNGRGAYICPDKECLKKAIKNKGLEKTLKISGIGEEIYSQLEKELGEINE